MATKTKHNHQVIFGRKEDDCPRCDELRAGAPTRAPWFTSRESADQQRIRAINNHFHSIAHRSGQCGPVCTYGEW